MADLINAVYQYLIGAPPELWMGYLRAALGS